MHFLSAAVLNPVTKELLEQMKILTMAIGSWIFFRRALTARKVVALVFLVGGVVVCVLSNVEGNRIEVPTLRGFCQV
jgi:drug/metabolite transporter (DMT)-like permease